MSVSFPAMVMESDLVASSDVLAFLPRRALPVMYAVALDLRIFANNVSSVSISIVLKLKLHLYLLISRHSSQSFGEGVG